MTSTELKNFAKALDAKEQELTRAVRNREGITVPDDGRHPPDEDTARESTERDLEIRNLNEASKTLREVRAAKTRMEVGGFGVCVHCGKDISTKRLNAIPWAKHCTPCQENADAATNQDFSQTAFA